MEHGSERLHNTDSRNVKRNWPIEEMRRHRADGLTLKAIGAIYGCSYETVRRLTTYGNLSRLPRRAPQPKGLVNDAPLGETPMQRAFRRFPIDRHKPCYD